METIYLVFEIGSGYIHGCFYKNEDAENKVKQLETDTGMNCYEIIITTIS